MRVRKSLAILALIAVSAVLNGCFDTSVKTLGGGAPTTSTTNNSESFAVNVAYRDSSADASTPIRVVQIEGKNDSSSQSFSSICGSDGSGCTCLFYTSTSSTSPTSASAVTYSSSSNLYSCTISGSAAPSTFKYVQLKSTTSASKSTGLLNISNNLTLQQVLNSSSLSASAVRKIYTYEVEYTFLVLESIGFTGTSFTFQCTGAVAAAGQHLGFLNGNYHFHLFSNSAGDDTNLSCELGTIYYSAQSSTVPGICGVLSIPQMTGLPATLTPIFGLYPTAGGQFTIAISLTPAPPGGSDSSCATEKTYGYAAPPDSNGNCPLGLVAYKPWKAIPATVTSDQLTAGCPAADTYPCNTSFNNLQDTQFLPIDHNTVSFSLQYEANTKSCSTVLDGTTKAYLCNGYTTANAGTLNSVPYNPQNPVICVIPSSML